MHPRTTRTARSVRRLVLAGGAALAALAGAGSPAAAAPSGGLRLAPCADERLPGTQCGTLRVPLDHARPGGPSTDLRVAVRRADDPARRIGPLLLNNGSGASAIEQLRLALGVGAVRGALAERFDLVAVDARGVGESNPVRCGRPQRSPGVTYFPDTPREFRAMVRDNRALYAACRERSGPVLEHLGHDAVARDLDAVRAALGEPRVSFYGIEHSTLVARSYARLFPQRLRDVTVDTVVDDALAVEQRIASEVRSVETGLERFAAWCATSDDCALRGQDVLARFAALRARADREPIPVRGAPSLGGEDLGRAAQEHLVIRLAWPGFAAALLQAEAGDATALTMGPDGTYDALQDHAFRCSTTPPAARSLAQLERLERTVRDVAPRTGGSSRAWTTAAGCIGWPDRPPRPDPGTPVRDVPPALVLQSTNQTLSAYANAFSYAARWPGSRVLSRDGDDYSLVLFSACAADAFERYADDGTLPAAGTVCRD